MWNIDLAPCSAWLAFCADLLSPDETARADRFLRAEDRDRFTGSHAALRVILGGALRAPPESLVFTTGAAGKPQISGEFTGRLNFNLSHSGSLALVGLAAVPIGVDIEVIRPLRDHLAIAQSHFHPIEIEAIEALPPNQRQAAFYACWTRKEAFVKAVGMGLSMPLNGFAVSIPPAPASLLTCATGGLSHTEWALHHLEPADGIVGAVAIAGANTVCDAFRLAPDWLDRLAT
ncbi:4'-phosphopantetheinyl transferase superfamily protein [Methylobacterium sp. BTF04]|uniref:4'-phosphopantetheinyl transferase family protein n=1 Tax=Methylobacterium sp. BTF04 TaxID=2708300 RepID=UPI0032B16106